MIKPPEISIQLEEREFKPKDDGSIYIILKRKPIWLTFWLRRLGIRRKEIWIEIYDLKTNEPNIKVKSRDYFMFTADFGRLIRHWFKREVVGFEGAMHGKAEDFLKDELTPK